MRTCGHCKKKHRVLFVIEGAPEVKDKTLRQQLADEGRGAVLGELELCPTCYRDGLPKKIGEAA